MNLFGQFICNSYAIHLHMASFVKNTILLNLLSNLS